MKAIFSLSCSLFLFFFSYGQFEVVVDDFGFSDTPYKLFKKRNNEFILANTGYNFFYQNNFVVFNNTGEQVFHYELNPDYGTATFIDIMEMPDSSVIWVQETFECGITRDRHLRYDKNWNQSNTGVGGEKVWSHFGGALSDYTFMSYQGDNVARRTETGEIIWERHFGIFEFGPFITGLVVTPGDSLIVATDDELVFADKDGEIVTTYPEYRLIRIMALGQGLLLGQKTDRWGPEPDSIFLLSPSFNLLGKIGFSGEEIIDIAVAGSRFAVLTTASHVYLYDETLALQTDFQVAIPAGRQLSFLALAPDGIVLAGTERYGLEEPGKGNNAVFLKKYNFDGATMDSGRDAGITSIEIEQEPVGYPFGAEYYKILFRDVKINVQNLGDSILQQVNVNIEFPMIDTLCIDGFQQFSKQYQGLSILPGQTAELNWQELRVTFDEDPTGSLEFCMWTSMPDQKLDRDASNDLYCTSLFVTGPEDEPAKNFSFEVFPNPSSLEQSTLRYQLPAGARGEVQVFNPVGNLVARFAVAGGQGTLRLGKQPPGLYFVALTIEGKLAQSLKFIQL